MLQSVLTRLFGSRNERVVKQMRKTVLAINALEPTIEKLSDDELREKTDAFKARIAAGETIDSLLVEAFAVVREASKRTLGLRHYDVQLVGGMTLHQGKIAEMRTGEGKTLVATAPVYLNALGGKGVHVVTVNDYLARRDAKWMTPVYAALGMTVGVIVPGQTNDEKRVAYACDIVYGTNNEFGFDYLRTNMAFSPEDRLQRELNFAIVDEVDSILIDEARTPLIISGASDESPDLYLRVNRVIPKLTRQQTEEGDGDYWVDEKSKQTHLSEAGLGNIEQLLIREGILAENDSLYDSQNLAIMHHLNAGLRAHALYQRDVDYLVRNGEVVIVDEFTGRTLAGRRWSDGLHQAIEAKEGVPIQKESQTLASITFQNYFRMFTKLSGMTGTADTEAFEFQQIYGLEVVVIPTNRPMVRKDASDLVFLNREDKFEAIIADIRERNANGQPILVGTTSVEASEGLSEALNKKGISHEVLNAKQHEREATIVAQAGRPGSVTIATNMAGRGTDIVLGGSLEVELHEMGEASAADIDAAKAAWKERHAAVKASGGLHIIGTERHESRRIDNQLRGRSGRQGDPGSSRFYLSFEDSLMRIFAPQNMAGMMQKLGMKPGESIEHAWVNKAIENAQRKVEAHNFDMRKNVLEYDDVANDQRKVIYSQRNALMDADSFQETIAALRSDVFTELARQFVPLNSIDEQWNLPGLATALREEWGIDEDPAIWVESKSMIDADGVARECVRVADELFERKEVDFTPEIMRMAERQILLQVLDRQWKEHLGRMDYLRQGIHLRGYAQKQPKQEYKREAFELFEQMLGRIKTETIQILAKIQIRRDDPAPPPPRPAFEPSSVAYEHADASAFGIADAEATAEAEALAGHARVQTAPVGRNDPCPCGSGKKYKQCHGKLA